MSTDENIVFAFIPTRLIWIGLAIFAASLTGTLFDALREERPLLLGYLYFFLLLLHALLLATNLVSLKKQFPDISFTLAIAGVQIYG